MANVSLPPPHHPFVDTQTGKVDDAWYRAISQITNGTNAALVSPVAVADGGTGSTAATAAFDALAPSTVQGTIAYRSSTHWVGLAPSSAGMVLETNGAGQNPTWANAAAPFAYGSISFGSSYAIESGFNVSTVTSSSFGSAVVTFSNGTASSLFTVVATPNNSDEFNAYSAHIKYRTTNSVTIATVLNTTGLTSSGFTFIAFQ